MELPHPHPIEGAHHGLAHKVGPFPVGVWLLIVAGGLAIAWYARQHSASSTSSTPTDPNADPSAADNGATPAMVSGGLDASGGSGQAPYYPPPPRAPGATTPRHRRVVHHHTPAGPSSYVVRAGDTLTTIAHRHHTTANKLYALNARLLNTTARRHGKRNSNHGHWIYAGERLRLR